MKKFYAMLVICACARPALCQTLFTYGNNAVSKDEFLKAYNKNKTPVTDKAASLNEYLNLYSKFKLKVKTAETLRLDTLSQLQYDLQNFRSQVEEGYMNDQKGMNVLVDEALARSQRDIHLIHFSVAVNSKMPAADTLKIYKAMNELAASLKGGKTNYDEIVNEISARYLPIKGKDLGYITAFSLPYEMENLVYGLKPGEVSRLYRTKNTLHLFKNADERKSAGKWKVAQILISIPPDVSGNELKAIEKKADSIYGLLTKGADFATLAKQFSEDKLTYLNGGEMPEFGTGKFELSFENNVFQLKKDGDITKPIFTGYGYHVVKRIHVREIPAGPDEVFTADVKQQVLQDSRVNAAKTGFLTLVKQKINYKRNPAVKDAMLYRYADSVSSTGAIQFYPINKKVIFSFAKQQVTGEDWLNFVKDYKLNQDVYKGETNEELLDKYISTASFEYYRKHLQEYNEEFKYQMQEFREGNMLFEIMERNVWSKAASDSNGLRKYYALHKENYKWAESANILLFNCADSNAASTAIAALKNGKDWKLIAEESEGKIQSDSGRYELSQLQLPQDTRATPGLITKPVINSGDNTTAFIKVLKMFPENQQRSFEEARGLVINEYQGYLEEEWMNELKKKYPIKVNDAVFQSMLK